MEFDALRRRFGAILGEAVPPHGLARIISDDRDGRFAQKQMIRAIVAIYEYLENKDDGHNTQTIPAAKTVQPTES